MNIQDFVAKNIWGIIVFVITASAFWATTNLRLNGIEAKAQEAQHEAASLRSLVERIIILEERNRNFNDILQEIKADVKEVKNRL
jgi:hypothetical protein